MTKISTAEARNDFADVINRASFGKERFVLTRRGKKLVAIVPVEDLDLLEVGRPNGRCSGNSDPGRIR